MQDYHRWLNTLHHDYKTVIHQQQLGRLKEYRQEYQSSDHALISILCPPQTQIVQDFPQNYGDWAIMNHPQPQNKRGKNPKEKEGARNFHFLQIIS